MPKLNEPIPLRLQLFDGRTDLFVQATIRNPSGVEIPESPINLTHIGNGLYFDNTLSMPNLSSISASYEVYEDVGYSVPSTDHSSSEDTFELVVLDAGLIILLDEVKALLNDLIAQGLSPALTGTVMQAQLLVGQVENILDIEGHLQTTTVLRGEVLDTMELSGTADNTDSLEGDI